MAPFGFGRKQGGGPQQPFITDITDGEDLEEIKKICHMLNPNEEVFVVARQSRLKPGAFFRLSVSRSSCLFYECMKNKESAVTVVMALVIVITTT
jgi:hypothetical protein